MASAGEEGKTIFRPGNALKPGRVGLGVDRAEAAAAADRGAHHERHAALLVGDVPELRGLIDEAVHRQRHEVPEHDLEHRPQPGDRGAVGHPGQGELGDRRVEDPFGAELLGQPGRGLEHAAGGGDVLAEEHDGRIALDLLGDRVADRGAELERAHARNSVAASATGSG